MFATESSKVMATVAAISIARARSLAWGLRSLHGYLDWSRRPILPALADKKTQEMQKLKVCGWERVQATRYIFVCITPGTSIDVAVWSKRAGMPQAVSKRLPMESRRTAAAQDTTNGDV